MSYLDKLKRAETEKPERGAPVAQKYTEPPQDDPIVTQDIMMSEFRRLQEGVIKFELKDFDYGWLRENQRDLYATIKAKEAEFERTEGKPLSVLLGLIREWVESVRVGYRLQTKAQPEQESLFKKLPASSGYSG